MIQQIEFTLRAYPRGIHLITGEILNKLPQLPEAGIINLLIKHTSAALALNENADPDVRSDLRSITCILTKGPTICPLMPNR